MGIFFALTIAWALSETFAHLRITLLGSRNAVLWAMLVAAITGAVLRWRQLARHVPPANGVAGRAPIPAPEAQRRSVISADSIRDDIVLARSVATARATQWIETDSDELDPNEIDMANAESVAKVQSHRDPALWHEATIGLPLMTGLSFARSRFRTAGRVLQWIENDRSPNLRLQADRR